MEKLRFTANSEQYNTLWSLAYWMQEISYEKQQNGGKDTDFLKDARQRINDLFSHLDRLNVPFWAQNVAIAAGENWKKYHQIGVPSLFRSAGIYFGCSAECSSKDGKHYIVDQLAKEVQL